MTNTIPNVPRELLERAWRALANSATGREIGAYLDADPCAPECAETCARASMCSTCSALLSAPSPAGVDGLEVVGHIDSDDDVSGSYAVFKNDCDLRDGTELVRLPDAQAIIDGLRGEVERLQFSLEVAKTDELSAAVYAETESIKHSLWDAEKERDQQARRICELEGLLYEASGELRTDRHHGLGPRIDAALSAGKDSAP